MPAQFAAVFLSVWYFGNWMLLCLRACSALDAFLQPALGGHSQMSRVLKGSYIWNERFPGDFFFFGVPFNMSPSGSSRERCSVWDTVKCHDPMVNSALRRETSTFYSNNSPKTSCRTQWSVGDVLRWALTAHFMQFVDSASCWS